METFELVFDERDGKRRLLAPAVGWFTRALAEGHVLVPGQVAGAITTLGRSHDLLVPSGASGVIRSKPRERIHAPVGFGEVLYEIDPLESAKSSNDGARATRDVKRGTGPLVMRSPQSGRFYHRPAPGEPAFVELGSVIEEGRPFGLIEVMKTFTHVVYRAQGGLPSRAKLLRMAASDGGEVRAGDALIELEPA